MLFLLPPWLTMPGHAQSMAVVRKGSFEVSAFAGGNAGAGGENLAIGGNFAFAFTRFLMPYVEASRFLLPFTIHSNPNDSRIPYLASYQLGLGDVQGGVHLRIPLREKRFVPYVVFGLGALPHFSQTVSATYTASGGGVTKIPLSISGGADFAVNSGAGLRYYWTERIGLRLEAKVYVPTGNLSPAFARVVGGIFFQLR